MQTLFVGIDASGAELVVAAHDRRFATRAVGNRSELIEAWLDAIPADVVLGIESTGRCHELLLTIAHRRGLRVYLLNPKDVRHYALGLGRRGKTDQMDAEVIARYLEREHEALHPHRAVAPDLAALERLVRRRAEVTRAAQALRQSLGDTALLKETLSGLLRQFQSALRTIDQLIDVEVRHCEAREALRRRLLTVPGVGPVVSALLVALFERIPFQTADAVVAYAGLDPRPADSGQHRGRRRLSKRGPSELRRLMFLAAMAFARSDAGRAAYERYRARLLSSTATFVILARKLLRITWSLQRSGEEFDPARYVAA